MSEVFVHFCTLALYDQTFVNILAVLRRGCLFLNALVWIEWARILIIYGEDRNFSVPG